MQEIAAFDLQRMFFGEHTSWIFLLEIVVRTTIMFSWTLLNVRFLGKRNMGQLTPFEFLITFALGSATGDPMFYPEVPLLHGMIVISTVVVLEKLLTYLSEKSSMVEQVVEGSATLVIEYGRIHPEFQKLQMSKDELFSRLRESGIEDVGQVKFAFMETSGKLSIVRYSKRREKRGEDTTSPARTRDRRTQQSSQQKK